MFDLVQERDTGRDTAHRTLVYILIHGESTPHEPETLTERGRTQAIELARSRIAVGVSHIYTSKMKEVIATSAVLAREFDCGVSEMKCLSDVLVSKSRNDPAAVKEHLPKMWSDPDYSPKNGESLFEARFRFGECVDNIGSKHRDQAIAIVTHPFIASIFLTLIFGGKPRVSDWLNIGFASCTTIEYSGKKWTLVMPPEDSYLSNPVSVRDTLPIELLGIVERIEEDEY